MGVGGLEVKKQKRILIRSWSTDEMRYEVTTDRAYRIRAKTEQEDQTTGYVRGHSDKPGFELQKRDRGRPKNTLRTNKKTDRAEVYRERPINAQLL